MNKKLIINVSNSIIIENSGNFLSSFLRENGSIENPKYLKAIKQGSSVEKIEQYLYFYNNINGDKLEMTRGLLNKLLNYLSSNGIEYEISYNYLENEKIEKIESKINKLRRYQIPLEDELSKNDHGYVIVPTGGGKTVVMINEIVKNKQKTIVMVTNTKLLKQFIIRLKQFSNLTDEDIGIFGDGKKEIKDITVVLVQSFSKLKDKEIQDITSKFDLFFVDESHHIVADTILKVCKNVKSKRFYGLTATPEKQEGAATLFLENVTGNLLYRVLEQELVQDEVILQPDIFAVINPHSKMYDFYGDFFKFEDRIINKYYIKDLLNKNQEELIELLIPKDFSLSSTLIIGQNKDEIYNFYNNLSNKLKDKTKVLLSSIFRKNQSVLEKNEIVIALDLPVEYKKVDMHKIKNFITNNEKRSNIISNIIIHEFKNNRNKDPNILIISDRIEHLEFMYNHLPESIKKYAVVLHAKKKKKELEEIEEKIEEKKYRIIFAIEKYVGEGWDVSHLDTLIMAYPLKDHESLKQFVGRVIRSKEGKKYAQVYDIVDINNPITLSQFKKRFNNYYKIYGRYNEFEIQKILNYKTE